MGSSSQIRLYDDGMYVDDICAGCSYLSEAKLSIAVQVHNSLLSQVWMLPCTYEPVCCSCVTFPMIVYLCTYMELIYVHKSLISNLATNNNTASTPLLLQARTAITSPSNQMRLPLPVPEVGIVWT